MNFKPKRKNKPSVLVVACDAGGAEVIAAYVKKHAHEKEFHSYVAGPAVRVFRRLELPCRRIRDSQSEIARVVREHSDAELVLLGLPGWMTSIELRVLTKAKEIGLRTVVYVDSWTLYRESFGYPKRGWRKNLPDELWVGDRYALFFVQRDLKRRARFVPNQYFANIRERYRKRRRALPPPDRILFLSSVPLRTNSVLSFLLSSLAHTGSRKQVRIRFHPADNRTRYDALIRRYRGKVRVEKSAEEDIANDLGGAALVVGMETVALAAAAQCGIRAVSILPRGGKKVLPFREIARMRLPATNNRFTKLIA